MLQPEAERMGRMIAAAMATKGGGRGVRLGGAPKGKGAKGDGKGVPG